MVKNSVEKGTTEIYKTYCTDWNIRMPRSDNTHCVIYDGRGKIEQRGQTTLINFFLFLPPVLFLFHITLFSAIETSKHGVMWQTRYPMNIRFFFIYLSQNLYFMIWKRKGYPSSRQFNHIFMIIIVQPNQYMILIICNKICWMDIPFLIGLHRTSSGRS